MNAEQLHRSAIVIDGLNVSNFGPDIFDQLQRGGVTAANCTCCIWENFRETFDNIVRWKKLFQTHAAQLTQVHTTDDILKAKRDGKVGVILGWQNITGIEDRIDYLQMFKAMGVGVMQLTYNTQNLVGTGCYESHDGGLSDFGHDVIPEMNRVGILIDLSHVGPNTSKDAIKASKKPVAYTHCLPSALKAHPRNKSDEQLRFIAQHNGFVGVTLFPPFLARGTDSTVDDYVQAIEHCINVVGEEQIGIGTDFALSHPPAFWDWIVRDKGTGRKLVELGQIINPAGLSTIDQFPNLTSAMIKRGWNEKRIRRVLGENWLRMLKEVWGA